jgi:hypothetical protein
LLDINFGSSKLPDNIMADDWLTGHIAAVSPSPLLEGPTLPADEEKNSEREASAQASQSTRTGKTREPTAKI